MSNKYWIGAALSLALCSTALTSCSVKDDGSGQGNATATSGVSVDWNNKTEKQLREAIANAPAHGLKPDLFLKGGEDGSALTDAALKYASALANGYADPSQLHEVYTIPHPKTDVRQGLADAIQKGDVKSWLESLAPQTDEYRALSQAHVHYLQLAQKAKTQPIPAGKPIKPGGHDPRAGAIRASLIANGILTPPQQPAQRNGAAQAAAAPSSNQYSPDLVAAVKKVQAEWGIKPYGVIGGATLDVLRGCASQRDEKRRFAWKAAARQGILRRRCHGIWS